MEKNVQVGLLFGFYQNMLTDKQIECIDLYYNEDLSLAEISELLGITRQGVRDNIKRAENSLYNIEEKLGLVKRFLTIKSELTRIDDVIKEIEASPAISLLPDNIKHKINDVLTIITNINEQEI
ncbi:MAG: YlxM family DNA-binding protein [Oscillospiraceae bacterium]